LIDATPDIKHQLHMLAPVLGPHPDRPDRLRQPDGIFLTHAHMGHLAGLAQLGPEAMAVQHLPVYAAAGLITLLRGTPLWRPLLARLDLVPVAAHEPVILAPDLWMTAIPVPHRDEWGAGTMAFHLQGPARSLLYLPDIDAWEQWPAARARLAAVDVALVDATFYSLDELGGRATTRSPSWQPVHPLVPHTISLFADVPGQLVLTHFNHTNPVLDWGSEERRAVLTAGVQIAQSGQVFNL
jgi:pyrroloquinoline quinone biosynthesis protein B